MDDTLYPLSSGLNLACRKNIEVLSRLGLDDCFEGVICFETLNPLPKQNGSADGHGNFGDTDGESDSSTDTASCVGGRKSNSKGRRILCKPSLEAVEAAIKIANIDPKRTVGSPVLVPGADVALESIHNMREALPQIWKDGDKLEPVLAATAAETTVLA
ncbi:hypothetical protein BHE74_00038188 [Ensete ventricosum]|nr:hypothetical protein BHE74_00038188 [Ensete ventricosum]RZS09271.1 hypothetical protein BHM03_00040335 [Ensete ventricosum]